MANSHLVRLKKTTKKQNRPKNNRIVGQMWLGILSELPLFYQTCPVGRTLLGKTAFLCAIDIIIYIIDHQIMAYVLITFSEQFNTIVLWKMFN